MNINFHYFVIKTLCVKSGFGEEEAQFLACVSQYVDDYNLKSNAIYIDNVPEYARHLTISHDERGFKFVPVTTGFSGIIDDIYLIINTKAPEMIVLPFHFITSKKLITYNISKEDVADPQRKELRTRPACLNEPSLMQEMLINAREKYIKSGSRENLMRIGMLLHTFADTYAHQGFSGLWGWENLSRLKSITDTKNNIDITKSYKPSFYAGLPALGHANLSTAPDDSFIRYESEHKTGLHSDYEVLCKRDNVAEYMKAAREIYNYILSCQGKENVSDEEWKKLETGLITGMYGQTQDIETCENTLYAYWKSIFPDINYLYDKDDILGNCFVLRDSSNKALSSERDRVKSLIKEERLETVSLSCINDDFFLFNVIAKEIRDCVNGYETPLQI